MPSFTLDFLNKNMYRKYPIRGTSTHLFTNGSELPQALLVAIQVTTTNTLYKCYISKIYVKNDYISVLIREVDTDIALGNFSGHITSNYQVLPMVPVLTQLSGSLTIGSKEALNLVNGANYLTTESGRIEDSAVFVYTPPLVTSIFNRKDYVTGLVTLSGSNINIVEASPTILLNVIDTNVILTKNDFVGIYGNCDTPLIYKLNSVPPDSQGNIDIFGIDPIKIDVSSGKIYLYTPELTLPDVCPDKNKLAPPHNNSESYYTDIENTHTPEWKSWPQFS